MDKFHIATGRSRFETYWKNKTATWKQIIDYLSKTTVTRETQGEYFNMSKMEQDKIKDVGGFVGGKLKDGKRRANSVESRSILTLDLDFAEVDFADTFGDLYDYRYIIYSTHKHQKEKPRLRLVLPLSRNASAEEYEAVGRKVAETIGIDVVGKLPWEKKKKQHRKLTKQVKSWTDTDDAGLRYYSNLTFISRILQAKISFFCVIVARRSFCYDSTSLP